VGVQEDRWDKVGTVRAGDYNFFYKKKSSIGNRVFVHYKIESAVKRVEFVSDERSLV